jgi:hypothetical protein
MWDKVIVLGQLASRTITEKWKIGVYSSPAMDYEY